jgi:GNAT superfamily N-acetyltransferase
MIEIKPMDECYVHTQCLHDGPVETTELGPYEDPLPGGHPQLPWSDEVLEAVVEEYKKQNLRSCPPAITFALELIRRYGSCAILAWEETSIVGQLFFYPMSIALVLEKTGHLSPFQFMWLLAASESALDDTTLWILCVMSSRPYISSQPDTITGRHWPTQQEAGARRGIGQRLVRGLIEWAAVNGWKRIIKTCHSDVDCLYGQTGSGGRRFWEKAGFTVLDSAYWRPEEWNPKFIALAERQGEANGMTKEDVWTWYRMVYILQ